VVLTIWRDDAIAIGVEGPDVDLVVLRDRRPNAVPAGAGPAWDAATQERRTLLDPLLMSIVTGSVGGRSISWPREEAS
jgi:hypothetical protein